MEPASVQSWRATFVGRTALIVLAWLACACSGARSPQPQTTSHTTTTVHQGPLTDYVPAAGLRWMVVVRPRELLEHAPMRRGLDHLFPGKRLDAFAKNSGIDLRELEVGLIAGYDIGTLYLAETRDAVEPSKQAFLARLASDPVTKRPAPEVEHITGLIGITPESFVGVKGRLIGISVKDPTLTKSVVGFALERFKKSPSALNGAALRHLPPTLATDPLQFYAPGPFSDEWTRGAHGLLNDTVAVGITARIVALDGSKHANDPHAAAPAGASAAVDVLAVLTGDYGNASKQTTELARLTFVDLAESGLGRLLSLHDPSVTPEIVATARDITLRVRLPLGQLLDGLYAAVAANVWDLLDYRPR